MNADMFISALGAIDDKFISEYADKTRKKTNVPAICAIAACFLVLFAGIVFLLVKPSENVMTYPNDDPHDPPPTVSCNGEYYTIAGKQIEEITDESKLKYIGTVQTYLKAEDWLKNPPTDDFCTNDAGAVGAMLYEYECEIVIRYKGKLLGCLKQKNTFSSSATTADNGNQDFYNDIGIYSEICPQKAYDYVMHTGKTSINDAVISECLNVGNGRICFGTPFTILYTDIPVYYFPIMENGNIIGTYRVYKDRILSEEADEDIYVGITSKFFADEYAELIELTGGNGNVLLFIDNGNIMAKFGANEHILMQNKEFDCAPSGIIPSTSSLNIIYPKRITQSIDDFEIINNTRPTYNYLPLSIIETQRGQ